MGRNLLNRIAKLEELMPWPLKPGTVWVLHFSPQDPQPTPAQIDWMIENYLANRRWPPEIVNMDCRGWFEVYQGTNKDEDDEEYEDEEEEEKEEIWFVNDDYDPASAEASSVPETYSEPPSAPNAAPESQLVTSIPTEYSPDPDARTLVMVAENEARAKAGLPPVPPPKPPRPCAKSYI
jgi:hypothetical protein